MAYEYSPAGKKRLPYIAAPLVPTVLEQPGVAGGVYINYTSQSLTYHEVLANDQVHMLLIAIWRDESY